MSRSSARHVRRVLTLLTGILISIGTALSVAPHAAAEFDWDNWMRDQLKTNYSCIVALTCLAIETPDGRSVDVKDRSSGDEVQIVANGNDRTYGAVSFQRWRFERLDDQSFRIVNNQTNKCIDTAWWNDADYQWACLGQESQKWYLEPIVEEGEVYWRIRQARNRTYCLDLLNGTEGVGAWVGDHHCKIGNKNQKWRIVPAHPNLTGTGTAVDLATKMTQESLYWLAFDYAGGRCEQDTSLCSYTATHESPATVEKCAVQATVDNTASLTESDTTEKWVETASWQNEIGGSISTTVEHGFGAGPAFHTKVAVTLTISAKHVWGGSTTRERWQVMRTPPGKWGFLLSGQLTKKVTGEWSFRTHEGAIWKTTGTHAFPVDNGVDNKSSVLKIVHLDSHPSRALTCDDGSTVAPTQST